MLIINKREQMWMSVVDLAKQDPDRSHKSIDLRGRCNETFFPETTNVSFAHVLGHGISLKTLKYTGNWYWRLECKTYGDHAYLKFRDNDSKLSFKFRYPDKKMYNFYTKHLCEVICMMAKTDYFTGVFNSGDTMVEYKTVEGSLSNYTNQEMLDEMEKRNTFLGWRDYVKTKEEEKFRKVS